MDAFPWLMTKDGMIVAGTVVSTASLAIAWPLLNRFFSFGLAWLLGLLVGIASFWGTVWWLVWLDLAPSRFPI